MLWCPHTPDGTRPQCSGVRTHQISFIRDRSNNTIYNQQFGCINRRREVIPTLYGVLPRFASSLNTYRSPPLQPCTYWRSTNPSHRPSSRLPLPRRGSTTARIVRPCAFHLPAPNFRVPVPRADQRPVFRFLSPVELGISLFRNLVPIFESFGNWNFAFSEFRFQKNKNKKNFHLEIPPPPRFRRVIRHVTTPTAYLFFLGQNKIKKISGCRVGCQSTVGVWSQAASSHTSPHPSSQPF